MVLLSKPETEDRFLVMEFCVLESTHPTFFYIICKLEK